MKTSCFLLDTPLFHCPSCFPFPLLFSPSLCSFSFLLPSTSFTPPPPFSAKPSCIQTCRAPYMAARLNMSHLIHPQRCKFTFHSFAARFTGGWGRWGGGFTPTNFRLKTSYSVTAWLKHACVCCEILIIQSEITAACCGNRQAGAAVVEID